MPETIITSEIKQLLPDAFRAEDNFQLGPGNYEMINRDGKAVRLKIGQPESREEDSLQFLVDANYPIPDGMEREIIQVTNQRVEYAINKASLLNQLRSPRKPTETLGKLDQLFNFFETNIINLIVDLEDKQSPQGKQLTCKGLISVNDEYTRQGLGTYMLSVRDNAIMHAAALTGYSGRKAELLVVDMSRYGKQKGVKWTTRHMQKAGMTDYVQSTSNENIFYRSVIIPELKDIEL
jgi:hypothetical protein